MKKIYLLVTLFIGNVIFGQTTTVTLSLSQGTGADAYLASGQGNTNYGSHPDIGGNTWTCGGNLCLSRGLFRFDLSTIPSTITSAYLSLYADNNWGANPTLGPGNDGFLQRVTAAWSETTVTWNNQPPTTTVNQVTIPASTSNVQNYTLNVTALVQDMLTNTNNGFLLMMQDEVNYYKSLMFASSDNSNSAKAPVLTITYNSVGIHENSADHSVIVSPNPSHTSFVIASDKMISKLVVFNALGDVSSESSSFTNSGEFGSELTPGVYYVTVCFSDNTCLKKKIVKL